jgi:4-hydroxybenzoate polyprenyltransferase
MRALIALFRVGVSGVAGLIAAGVYVGTADVAKADIAAGVFLTVWLSSVYAFLLNDIVDCERDRIGHPERALPRNLVSKRLVVVFAFGAAAGACGMAAVLGTLAFVVAMLATLISSTYSFVKVKSPLAANTLVGVNGGLTVVFGMMVGRSYAALWVIALGTVCLLIGREIILDIRDMSSDGKGGIYSIPVRYGRPWEFCIDPGSDAIPGLLLSNLS